MTREQTSGICGVVPLLFISLLILSAAIVAGCDDSPQDPGSRDGAVPGVDGPALSDGPAFTGDVFIGPNGCTNQTQVISLATVTPLGFSAEGLLETIGGEHSTELTWLKNQDYASHSRSGTQTGLTLSVAHEGGEIRFVDSKGGNCGNGNGSNIPCLICDPWFEIDVKLGFTTEDGALSESFPVTLSCTAQPYASVTARIKADAVQGSYFDEVVPKDSNKAIVAINIEAAYGAGVSGSSVVDPAGWNGFVAAVIGAPDSADLQGVYQAHGSWPVTVNPR